MIYRRAVLPPGFFDHSWSCAERHDVVLWHLALRSGLATQHSWMLSSIASDFLTASPNEICIERSILRRAVKRHHLVIAYANLRGTQWPPRIDLSLVVMPTTVRLYEPQATPSELDHADWRHTDVRHGVGPQSHHRLANPMVRSGCNGGRANRLCKRTDLLPTLLSERRTATRSSG